MFKTLFMTVICVSTFAIQTPAHALDSEHQQNMTALGAIALGTAAAGPVGFVLGAVGGGWLAQKVAAADDLTRVSAVLAATESRLEISQQQVASRERTLQQYQAEQERFARMALDQLQLDMLFKTGASQLTQAGEERLALLATFLKRNTTLDIHIEGYADPRGSTAANLALSKARAQGVANALSAKGVARVRMSVVAYGESQSTALPEDHDSYALERRVNIELRRQGDSQSVAAIELR